MNHSSKINASIGESLEASFPCLVIGFKIASKPDYANTDYVRARSVRYPKRLRNEILCSLEKPLAILINII